MQFCTNYYVHTSIERRISPHFKRTNLPTHIRVHASGYILPASRRFSLVSANRSPPSYAPSFLIFHVSVPPRRRGTPRKPYVNAITKSSDGTTMLDNSVDTVLDRKRYKQFNHAFKIINRHIAVQSNSPLPPPKNNKKTSKNSAKSENCSPEKRDQHPSPSRTTHPREARNQRKVG